KVARFLSEGGQNHCSFPPTISFRVFLTAWWAPHLRRRATTKALQNTHPFEINFENQLSGTECDPSVAAHLAKLALSAEPG
ncbi:hypothetical protein CEXT_71211, partial [Caerostris extrusa]